MGRSGIGAGRCGDFAGMVNGECWPIEHLLRYAGSVTLGPTLLVALDAAYGAFAGYLRPQRMEASSMRDPARILATLSSAPLRDLTGEQIGPYAGWALTTVGSVTDYKHFLPRILEQAVRDSSWLGTQPPVIASRLNMAEWRSWPEAERSAVIQVFMAALRGAISQHPDEAGGASEWLCALATIGEDIQPILQAWVRDARGNALLQIANLAMELPTLVSMDAHEQLFWADVASETRTAIVTWLNSAEIGAAFAGASEIAESDMWRIDEGMKAIAEAAGSTRH
ncbi:hypothetical protein DSM104635_01025 [Terricaulis silvestris]|uniref:Uncharacterized protein n=2 Tax=Terricaulis silvestris TaxID=2686094 RepID=A0A6I6MI92_9CAUL|nr:hypothetical protein DSM104635_01025 [Terricaulis silvestris]